MIVDLVSILIPNYNKESYLCATLNSIIAQTYSNWECIVVDDHSTDNSWGILEGYSKKDSRIKVYKRPNHLSKGGNVCRNYAYTKSTGRFVVFFDSDDLFYPNAIEERYREISNNNWDFFVSNGILWNGKDEKGLFISNWTQGNVVDAFINIEPVWLTQGVIIKKDFIVKNAIIWDERVPFYQDVLYNLKLVIVTENYKISSKIDWVWYVPTNNSSLGSKTKKINSYSENDNYISSFYDCITKIKDCQKQIKLFAFNRIHFLINANLSNIKSKPIEAYFDFLNKKKILLNRKERVEIFILKIALYSFEKNYRIGKSIYFRFKNSSLKKTKKNIVYNHFLSKEVPFISKNIFKSEP